MLASVLRRRGLALAAVFAAAATTTTAFAATYNYVSWTSADVAGGTASGVIPLGGDAGVQVTFTATTADGGAGNLSGAQTGGSGTSYWTPAATYESSAVENAPPTPDILQLAGGENETYTVNLSEPIVDPIMAIVSLGASGSPITYNFDSPFTIVSQGTDPWGGSASSLVQLPNNVLQGAEGSGVIQFIGTYSQFSWTVPTPEYWHGFTFGILTSAALYDGGGPDGSAVWIGDGGPVDAGSPASDDGAAPDAGAGPDARADVATEPDAESPPDADIVEDDATVPDDAGLNAGSGDNGGAARTTVTSSGMCSCKAAGLGGGWSGGAGAAAVLGAVALLSRRRSRRR
jgi:hypothetical protein